MSVALKNGRSTAQEETLEDVHDSGSGSNKFGGVHYSGRRRSFGGDWHARRAIKSARPARSTYSKKSNQALKTALEQTVNMTVADKEQLIKYLQNDILSEVKDHHGESKTAGRRHPSSRSPSRSPTRANGHTRRRSLPKIGDGAPDSDVQAWSSSVDEEPVTVVVLPSSEKAGSPRSRVSPSPETNDSTAAKGQTNTNFFKSTRDSMSNLVSVRNGSHSSTATFTPAEIDDFVGLLEDVSKHLTPSNVRKCIFQLNKGFDESRAKAGNSGLIRRASSSGSDASEASEGDSPSRETKKKKAKNRFLSAVKRVKRGLYTNRMFMHSHRSSMTTRDALLEAGATNEGLDLAAMLRILDSLGFKLSKEESKAAEKYVSSRRDGKVRLEDFEMFLSDLGSTKEVVKKAKLRGAGRRIFLGGSCNPTTWRKDVAIPLLVAHDVPFFNPQVDDWDPSLVAMEAQAKAEAPVLLFVIDAATRAIASMIEVVELISEGYTCVVVIHEIQPDQVVAGEIPSKAEVKDLNRARAYLADVISRHSLPVFSNIGTAVQHSITLWSEIMDQRNDDPQNHAVERSISVKNLLATTSSDSTSGTV